MIYITIGYFNNSLFSVFDIDNLLFGMFYICPVIYSIMRMMFGIPAYSAVNSVSINNTTGSDPYLYYNLPVKHSAFIRSLLFEYIVFQAAAIFCGLICIGFIYLLNVQGVSDFSKYIEMFTVRPFMDSIPLEKKLLPFVTLAFALSFPYGMLGSAIHAAALSQKYYGKDRMTRFMAYYMLITFIYLFSAFAVWCVIYFLFGYTETAPAGDFTGVILIGLLAVFSAAAGIFCAITGLRKMDRVFNLE
jgi:hypothetical protein